MRSVTVDFTDKEYSLIERSAETQKISVQAFVYEAVMDAKCVLRVKRREGSAPGSMVTCGNCGIPTRVAAETCDNCDRPRSAT